MLFLLLFIRQVLGQVLGQMRVNDGTKCDMYPGWKATRRQGANSFSYFSLIAKIKFWEA